MNTLYLQKIEILKNIREAQNDYFVNLPIIKNLESITCTTPVTFIMGDNGSGKSTLLEAIAVAYGFNAEGGSMNFNFATQETHSQLHQYLKLTKGIKRPSDGFFLRAESFYNVASEVDKLYEDELRNGIGTSFGSKSLHQQSHGESFLALMQN